MNKRRFICLLLVLTMFIPTAALYAQTEEPGDNAQMGDWETCDTPAGLGDKVTLGASFALSGAAAVYGVPQKQAVELAVKEINDSKYLGDTTLEVLIEDDAGDKTQATTVMTKLVTEDKVLAVIGPTLSASAFAADPIAQENKTVVLGVSNTANGITDMGDYVFRNSLPEAEVIPGVIAQAVETLGIKQVGILYGNDDDFTKSGYEVFKKALGEHNVTIQTEETFLKGDVEFNTQLAKIISNKPDAIIVSALAAEAAPIITQVRQQGFTGPIIGGNGFNSPAVIKNSGEAAEGVIVGAAWNIATPSEQSTAFVEAYQAAYENALPDQFAAQAYTGTWLMATALRCADSTDHAAIRSALADIKDFESPLGTFSFDENRNPVHEPVAQIVKGGKFALLGTDESMDATMEATASQ